VSVLERLLRAKEMTVENAEIVWQALHVYAWHRSNLAGPRPVPETRAMKPWFPGERESIRFVTRKECLGSSWVM
jgi:hypothetical protein